MTASLAPHPWDALGPPQPLDPLDGPPVPWTCAEIDGIDHSPKHDDRAKCADVLEKEADEHDDDAQRLREESYEEEDSARECRRLAELVIPPRPKPAVRGQLSAFDEARP